jgi:sugar phosphate isomerase/epimerase
MTSSAAPAAWLASYRRELRAALAAARGDGYRRIVASTLQPDFNPREFGATARRHFAKHLRDLGLGLDALALPWSGGGLADAQRGDERLAQLRATLELCGDLGVRRATATVAGLGGEQPDALAGGALAAVADLADRTGIQVALHVPGADPVAAATAIGRLGCPGVRLALDSASPLTVQSGIALSGMIGLAQLRDVRRAAGTVEEVEFGQGDVDFEAVLGVLSEAGGDAPLVIRRDAPDAGVDALRQGREYIQSLLIRPRRR